VSVLEAALWRQLLAGVGAGGSGWPGSSRTQGRLREGTPQGLLRDGRRTPQGLLKLSRALRKALRMEALRT
jgi:hypothetical protein